MLIMGIESSCDETSVSVIEEKMNSFFIKSNIIASQIEVHKLYGGVVPEIASRAHIEAISKITYEALNKAGVKINDIDLIAVTANPGLIGALLVGVNFAKALAYANSIPLVAVDHMKGHVGASYLTGGKIPKAPFIALVVSGGHTAIYRIENHFDYELVGTTRDDAAGEAFDKVGRILGIPYPAGAEFDRMARRGFEKLTGRKENFFDGFDKVLKTRLSDIKLPSPAIADGSLDFSFSGLKTAAINIMHKYEARHEELEKESFAAAYTYQVVSAIENKLSTALDRYGAKTVVLAGGVAANSHLRERVIHTAKAHGAELFLPPPSLCGDNGAMIAVEGYFAYMHGERADLTLNASALDGI
ncbi:MAG: tRNA (adenosine(37)-N6)-threonylcarbamoyltransferase complex transferase subunit TsaD [Eubacteriales bacterium]|nr:tRNA (adenosine(37)-N6)-threonylcarbamoyltransferase complex transferase subunit TsaD [Eubacteriales bacterium]